MSTMFTKSIINTLQAEPSDDDLAMLSQPRNPFSFPERDVKRSLSFSDDSGLEEFAKKKRVKVFDSKCGKTRSLPASNVLAYRKKRVQACDVSKDPARWWIVVINNPTAGDIRMFEEVQVELPDVRYVAFAKETGESGTPHLQGFIGFKVGKRFPAVKKIFPGAHIEQMRGSFDQNLLYVSKEGGQVFISGTPPMKKSIQGMAIIGRAYASMRESGDYVYMSPEEYQRNALYPLNK